jgi:hypothetical protein
VSKWYRNVSAASKSVTRNYIWSALPLTLLKAHDIFRKVETGDETRVFQHDPETFRVIDIAKVLTSK